MGDNYIIEVTMPNTGEIKYLTAWNDLTSDPNGASRYVKQSVTAAHKILNLPRDLNPRLVDRRMVIGTYISTYRSKYRLNHLIDYAEDKPLLQIIILPFLLSIGLLIYLTRKIKDKYNKYVTNHR